MNDVVAFLERYGEWVLVGAVFAQQIGVPIPAIPVLLGAGAIAGAGKMHFGIALVLAVIASIPGDLFWYVLGWRRGRSVLATLCRISLEPDSCVRRTEAFFVKHGPASLLVARFLPGLSTVATPLAGVFRVRFARFLAYDVAGAFLYAVVFLGLGYVLGDRLERLAGNIGEFGTIVTVLVVAAAIGYVAFRLGQRQWMIRRLRVRRVEVDDVKRMLDGGDELVIVDLRSAADLVDEPFVLPGALRVDIAQIETEGFVIPRDREIVLYCT